LSELIEVLTKDGSYSLRSKFFQENFHSLLGALEETKLKFTATSNLQRFKGKSLNVLDICFGLGYNSASLLNELINNNFLIEKPKIGISFDIPLTILESIFDFWLDIYKNPEAWETCLGLLKIRKRISLKNLIESESLMGNSKKWAIKIETLHTYVPSSLKNEKLNDPMWE